ncbi:MAG: VOC family protein [Erysipelotrichaceae bacterium]|nr:VOC family protein [Erysipelotrichaceae bacterium]
MKLDQIDHIAIIVTDLDKAEDFYVDKLGFTIIRKEYRQDRNDTIVMLSTGESENSIKLELFAEKNPPARVSHPEACGLRHLAFHVDDVEKAVLTLKEKDIECEPVRTDPYTHNRMTFFHDPDGLPLELHE